MGTTFLNTDTEGHWHVEFEDEVGWEDFPNWATRLVASLGGRVGERIDGPDARVWRAVVGSHSLDITFEDFPLSVQVRSLTPGGEGILRDLIVDRLRSGHTIGLGDVRVRLAQDGYVACTVVARRPAIELCERLVGEEIARGRAAVEQIRSMSGPASSPLDGREIRVTVVDSQGAAGHEICHQDSHGLTWREGYPQG